MLISLQQLSKSRKALGINCTASKTEIRKAFHAKAKLLHPDRWQHVDNKAHAYSKWYTLVKAYNLLKSYDSPVQKARYKGPRHNRYIYDAIVPYGFYNPTTHQRHQGVSIQPR